MEYIRFVFIKIFFEMEYIRYLLKIFSKIFYLRFYLCYFK
jgi:hypothetical protein